MSLKIKIEKKTKHATWYSQLSLSLTVCILQILFLEWPLKRKSTRKISGINKSEQFALLDSSGFNISRKMGQNWLIVLALLCYQHFVFMCASVFLNYRGERRLTGCKPQFVSLPSAFKPLIIAPLTIYALNPVLALYLSPHVAPLLCHSYDSWHATPKRQWQTSSVRHASAVCTLP